MDATHLVIDQGFKAQLPILSIEERVHLENNLLADGCLHPLVAWDNIILDGHNRYEICTAHNIPFDVVQIEGITSREDAAEWIDKHQLGKRNLTPDDFRIVSGRLYNRRKQNQGGDKKSKHQIEVLIPENTAEQVAAELGTSKATIERNGQRAAVYDAVLATGDTEAAEVAKVATQSVIAAVKDKSPQVAAAELKARSAVHVSQNTGMPEWYTPDEYLVAARNVLGGITFDPASSAIAQERVQADEYCTFEENGLDAEWHGTLWMNPPYTAGLVDQFSAKLLEHYKAGEVVAAIVLVNNATETRWWQLLCAEAAAICLPQGRIKFLDPDGNPGAPLQGQSLLYFGENVEAFDREFSAFGAVLEVLA